MLDTSGSMSGQPIEQVKNGVQMLISALRQDPYALETAYLSVITFGSTAQEAVKLTELTAFQPPALQASGATALGAALELVSDLADRDVKQSSPTAKGDWKPMVFLMTDGTPTDDWQRALPKFKQRKWGAVVGCSVNNGDIKTLHMVVGPAVVQLDTTDASAMAQFFKWVSASISSNSKAVETSGKEAEGLDQLPPPPPEIKIV
jgi:uncharacterized protein YegL